MVLVKLFIEFFKIGLFAVGGGLATLPFLYDLAEKYDWFTRADLANMIAISESTPGPIGVNMATYVGFHTANGVLGGIITTFALVLPSLIIIIIISKFLNRFDDNKYVKAAFCALRPTVTGLIAVACLEVYKTSFLAVEEFVKSHSILQLIDLKCFLIFVVILFLIMRFKKHPVIYIALGAVIGAVLRL